MWESWGWLGLFYASFWHLCQGFPRAGVMALAYPRTANTERIEPKHFAPLCGTWPRSANDWGHFLSVRPTPRRLLHCTYWDKAKIRTANVATITASHGARLLTICDDCFIDWSYP